MSEHLSDYEAAQQDLFETAATRTLLDRLLTESQMYKSSKDYKALLDFVVRLREFAPFNAMLLQVQKPGLAYAASSRDWMIRFGRYPKEGARPLLIMWPFGPVALVYDVEDTDGQPLPEDVSSFIATGQIGPDKMAEFAKLIRRRNIELEYIDAGADHAGRVKVKERAASEKQANRYCVYINKNHALPVQFSTLAHELAHLFLGHLGPDRHLGIGNRPGFTHPKIEIEAESVAYVVCNRNNVEVKSQTYLSQFVCQDTRTEDLDLYQVMLAAGRIETILKLGARSNFKWPGQNEQIVLDGM